MVLCGGFDVAFGVRWGLLWVAVLLGLLWVLVVGLGLMCYMFLVFVWFWLVGLLSRVDVGVDVGC